MQVPPITGKERNVPDPTLADPWLHHLSQVSYIRGHISVFAVGSVVLLAANLLLGSGGVWADTVILAWGVLVVAHGIIAVIARLLQELLADDEQEVRPASEMRWNAPSTWAIQPRSRENHAAPANAAPTASQPDASTPPETPVASPADTERVSWQAATDAAWLAPRDSGGGTSGSNARNDTAPTDTRDDDNENKDDFTPLKLD